jgi:8-oxo-dGTP pyrophosphatase MutT (NUDIX family)
MLRVPSLRLKALVWILRPDGVRGPQVLLLERPKRRGGGLHPVTGKADRGESARACAEREAHEETGLAGPMRELGHAHRFRQFEEHAFAMTAKSGAEPTLSDEHVGHRWVAPAVALAAVEWPAHRESLELALLSWKED